MDFDAFELCSSDLQNKLIPMREKFKELEDSQLEESRKVKSKKDKDDEVKPKVRQEPFWFEDGKKKQC